MSTTPGGPPHAPEPLSADDGTRAPAATANRRLIGSVFALAALVLAADQLTKWWALESLGPGGWAVALGMLLGGAVGNLADRLAREPGFGRGHVVDFLDYAGFFVGNVADIAIRPAAA